MLRPFPAVLSFVLVLVLPALVLSATGRHVDYNKLVKWGSLSL